MAKNGTMEVYKTVDDYIAAQPEGAKIILMELRQLIKESVPEVVEIQNSKVPTFTLIPGTKPKLQLMIVAYTKFVSFYPFQAAIDFYTAELQGFELGKGTIRFPFNQKLPKDLILKMIQFRKNEILNQQR